MKILRGVLGGVSFGIIWEFFGCFIYGILFLKWTLEANQIWRPMDSLETQIGIPLADISSGLTVAFAYSVLYKGIPGAGLKKGLVFGLILWLIMSFAGKMFFYASSPIPFMLLVAGWLHGLIVMSLGGVVIAAIYGKSLEEETGVKSFSLTNGGTS